MNSFELILLSTLVRGAAVVLLLMLAGRYLPARHMRSLWLFGCFLILIPQTTFSFLPFRLDLSGLRGEGVAFRKVLREVAHPANRTRSLRDPMLAKAGIPFPDRRVVELLLIPLLPAGTLLLLGLRYRRCRRMLRNLPPVTDIRTLTIWRQVTEGQGSLKHLPVLLDSSGVTTVPALFGCVHPRLLLPGDRLARLEEGELVLLLEHEYRHIAGKDPFRNFASLLFWSISWYNPFAWIARNELRKAIEQECDWKVLEHHPGSLERYGELLLHFASGREALSLGLADKKRELKARIRLMMLPKEKRGSLLAVCCLALLLAAPLCLVAVKTHAVRGGSETPSVSR